MLKTIAQRAAGTVLAALLAAGFATPASAATALKEPKIKGFSATQTYFPDANFYGVDATLSWKAVKGADVYLVCSEVNGAQDACHTGIHDTTYTYSLNGMLAGTRLNYYVIACDTLTGPSEVCVRSQSSPDVIVGA